MLMVGTVGSLAGLSAGKRRVNLPSWSATHVLYKICEMAGPAIFLAVRAGYCPKNDGDAGRNICWNPRLLFGEVESYD
jgi:hypothetical protein